MDASAQIDTAISQHQAGRLEQAKTLYLQILQNSPQDADALHLLGLVFHQLGEHQAAIDHIKRALAVRPEAATFHTNLGAVYQAAEDLDNAVASCQRALQITPGDSKAHFNLACAYQALGKLDEAVLSYRSAIQITPGYLDAHVNLGNSLKDQGKLEDAVACFRRAIQIRPNYAQAHNNLGSALRDLEQPQEAIASFRRALAVDPNYAEAQRNLGLVLKQLGQSDAAIARFRRAIDIKPDCAETQMNLGDSLRDRVAAGDEQKVDEAIASYHRALAIDSNFAAAHRNLGLLLKYLGKFDEAIARFEQAVRIKPDYTDALADLVQTWRGSEACEATVGQLEELLARQDSTQDERRRASFALGDYYDRCQQWERAFGHYERGNSLAATKFDCRPVADKIQALIETCTPSLLQRGTRLGISSDLPVLIVGMPRSGTSLVEQILASHSAVAAAGELPYVGAYADSLQAKLNSNASYPACLEALDRETAHPMGGEYLEHLQNLCTDEVRVTDKMPSNFFHLGLLSLLLPRARIIHCRRHPLDVCLSCYFRNFDRSSLSFTNDLCSLGLYYRQYSELMEHWRQVLPQPMLEVAYEDLVADSENVSRQLLEFCGLPWDPACLEFHKTERVVRTASKWQVRQPIYQSAVGRWKQYEKYLGPLKDALGAFK